MQYLPPISSLRNRVLDADLESTVESPEQGAIARSVPPAGGEPQRIAVLVRDGVHRAQVDGLLKVLDLRGHDVRVLAERLGSVVCSDGSRIEIDASLRRWPAWYFDSVVRLSNADQASGRMTQAEAEFMQTRADAEAIPLTCLPWPVTARGLSH